MPSTFNWEAKINNLAKTPFLPSPLGLALKKRGTAKEPVTTERENLLAAEESRGCSMHASLAAACLRWRCCQQERVTRRAGAAWKGAWMLAELFTFCFLSFSTARSRLQAHSNFYVQDRSSSTCLTQSPVFWVVLGLFLFGFFKEERKRTESKACIPFCRRLTFQMLQTYLIPWTL